MCPRFDTTPRWRNWQTHYFEVVAPKGVQVQILSWALFEQRAPQPDGRGARSFLVGAGNRDFVGNRRAFDGIIPLAHLHA